MGVGGSGGELFTTKLVIIGDAFLIHTYIALKMYKFGLLTGDINGELKIKQIFIYFPFPGFKTTFFVVLQTITLKWRPCGLDRLNTEMCVSPRTHTLAGSIPRVRRHRFVVIRP